MIDFTRKSDGLPDTLKIELTHQGNISVFYELINSSQSIIQRGAVEIEPQLLPTEVALYPAYPNPFNPVTTIRYDVPLMKKQSKVKVEIFDVTGRTVRTLINEKMQPGNHSVQFHATNIASGIYFIRLTIGPITKTQKILLLK